MIHTVQGFSIVHKAQVDILLKFSLLFLWSYGCCQFDLWFLVFSNSRLAFLKFSVHVLMKPSLKDFSILLQKNSTEKVIDFKAAIRIKMSWHLCPMNSFKVSWSSVAVLCSSHHNFLPRLTATFQTAHTTNSLDTTTTVGKLCYFSLDPLPLERHIYFCQVPLLFLPNSAHSLVFLFILGNVSSLSNTIAHSSLCQVLSWYAPACP